MAFIKILPNRAKITVPRLDSLDVKKTQGISHTCDIWGEPCTQLLTGFSSQSPFATLAGLPIRGELMNLYCPH